MGASSRIPRPQRIKLRIMGSEIEFGMRFVVPPQKDSRAFQEKLDLATGLFAQGNYATSLARLTLPANSRGRPCGRYAILDNQGQVYIDCNAQIEYATPECLGAENLALYETAGLDIIAHAVKRFNIAYADRLAPIKMYKTNRDTELYESGYLSRTSWGSHANYLTLRRAGVPELEQFWLPFLETRWCIIGNGWVDFFDKQYVHFLFSQRADVMMRSRELRTTDVMKPLIHDKGAEVHARQDVWRRLHDISGNANMSHKQLVLKYATADIVLAMIEAGDFLREPPHFNEGRHSANEICRCFNGDIFGRVRLACDDGMHRGFLDVQEFYIEEALRFFGEGRATLTDERKRALEWWQAVIDAMRRRDLKYVSRFLDWAALLRQFEFLFEKMNLDFDAFCDMETDLDGRFVRYPAERGVAWNTPVPRNNKPMVGLLCYLLEYITQYADVETARSPYGILVAKGVMDALFTPEQIARAVADPPSRTRAHLRKTIEALIRLPHSLLCTSWDNETVSIRVQPGAFLNRNISLQNPYRFLIGPEEKRILDQVVSDEM